MSKPLNAVNSDLFLPEKGQNRDTNCDQCYFFVNYSGSVKIRVMKF